jgi:uncharacterized damage-inducible protein DinB
MKRMTHLMAVLCLLGCAATAVAQQAKTGIAKTLNEYVSHAEGEFVPAAEAMPEDKYSFAPSEGEFKGVRSFGEQVKHVAAVNYVFGAGILGEKPPVDVNQEKGPDSVKSKAEIMQFLKDSFTYLHKALATVNAGNLTTPVQWGNRPTSRLQIVLMAAGHPWDHYGQMVVYLRMNGIVPPASR